MNQEQIERQVDVPVAPPKYPTVYVTLLGEDGNAFSILARVAVAMRRAGLPRDEFEAFHAEAVAGDYNHLLRTVMAWVETKHEGDEDNSP